MSHIITIDESQRQLLLMALAHLAVERPGFDCALREIADKMDNPGPQLYLDFKRLHSEQIDDEETSK
jgi:hypothetical protein